jgi:uncharacterized protein YyaL (SSP411 family)
MGQSQRANRLINEKSPYLLQHAYNPVDWYPWGKEAFEAAAAQNKPIFLSIGYSTCHFCHVMEKESFEDQDTAEILNQIFINIKVDREELPEVDNMYMDIAQVLMSSAAGWPLNVILTPDLKPFYAMTYMPAKSKKGMIGLQEIAKQIQQLWQGEEKNLLLEQAAHMIEMIENHATPDFDALPESLWIEKAVDMVLSSADPLYGGYHGLPKFPLSFTICFLLHFGKKFQDSRALFFATNTLDKMASGGIHDQLGGGFSRYALDDAWRIPHFEKMLFDNANLISAYLEGYKLTRNEAYRHVCEKICDYITGDLQNKDGGFFSAQDADSDGIEGNYYTWSYDEIFQILPSSIAQIFCLIYGISVDGNFHGKNVLYVNKHLDSVAEELGVAKSVMQKDLEKAKNKLALHRKKRLKPFIDDKIITSYNGLAIDALAKAGFAFERKDWIDDAVRAAEFVMKNLWIDGKFFRRFRDGQVSFAATIDDYASMIMACLSLFDIGCGSKWLKIAIDCSHFIDKEFSSGKGAYFFSAKTDSVVPVRKCEFYDGAEPSGNALQADNLLRLYQITFDDQFLSFAENILSGARQHIETYTIGSCASVKSLFRYYDLNATTVFVALDSSFSLKEEIAREFRNSYSPHVQVVWIEEGDASIRLLIPQANDKRPIDGQTAVYLCDRKGCRPPMIDIKLIKKAIQEL